MADIHEHPAGHMHLQDPEANVAAIIADLEYFRRKRLEPRVLLFSRRRVVGVADLFHAAREVDVPRRDEPPTDSFDERIAVLQKRLDGIVTGILTLQVPLRDVTLAIDDTRRERGDYEPYFRIEKREFPSGLRERIEALERAMDDDEFVIATIMRAMVRAGRTTDEAFAARREQLRSIGWRNGARIVARAWVDDGFKARLLETGRQAVRELDIPPGRLGLLGVAENTDRVHNVVVCTLCSCYPHDLLGDPPWWYRTDSYKERIIQDPHRMLEEAFGLRVDEGVEVRVHDSTSDVRWMVLPQRPAGTEGMSEEALAELVTAESLVGTARAGEAPVRDEHIVDGLGVRG